MQYEGKCPRCRGEVIEAHRTASRGILFVHAYTLSIKKAENLAFDDACIIPEYQLPDALKYKGPDGGKNGRP